MGVVQIAYRNIAIDPDTVKVKVGSTLEWTNYDHVTDNVTTSRGPEHFASGTSAKGATFEFKLDQAGHDPLRVHATTRRR